MNFDLRLLVTGKYMRMQKKNCWEQSLGQYKRKTPSHFTTIWHQTNRGKINKVRLELLLPFAHKKPKTNGNLDFVDDEVNVGVLTVINQK